MAVNDEGQARSNANVAIKTRLKEGVEKSAPSFRYGACHASLDHVFWAAKMLFLPTLMYLCNDDAQSSDIF